MHIINLCVSNLMVLTLNGVSLEVTGDSLQLPIELFLSTKGAVQPRELRPFFFTLVLQLLLARRRLRVCGGSSRGREGQRQ